jgi:hypothetical protein
VNDAVRKLQQVRLAEQHSAGLAQTARYVASDAGTRSWFNGRPQVFLMPAVSMLSFETGRRQRSPVFACPPRHAQRPPPSASSWHRDRARSGAGEPVMRSSTA